MEAGATAFIALRQVRLFTSLCKRKAFCINLTSNPVRGAAATHATETPAARAVATPARAAG